MHESAIGKLGFPALAEVQGRLSIADLIPPSKRRPGLYILAFANGSFYVGQAIDPVRRFSQHRTSVGGIVGFGFTPCRLKDLDTKEQAIIRAAEARGLPITNRVHVSRITGETDLDLIVSRKSQERWLASGGSVRRGPRSVQFPVDSPARVRTQQRYDKLKGSARYEEVAECLGEYVNGAIIFPGATQLTFWSLSCLPATGSAAYRRFAVVNAGMMELCVLGHARKGREETTWGFVNLSRSVLADSYGGMRNVRAALRGFEIDSSRPYRSAGQDQIRIVASSIGELTTLLRAPHVMGAARDLSLRVMRSRATIYSQYHCPDLADAIMRRSGGKA